jgi:hypothetical protein
MASPRGARPSAHRSVKGVDVKKRPHRIVNSETLYQKYRTPVVQDFSISLLWCFFLFVFFAMAAIPRASELERYSLQEEYEMKQRDMRKTLPLDWQNKISKNQFAALWADLVSRSMVLHAVTRLDSGKLLPSIKEFVTRELKALIDAAPAASARMPSPTFQVARITPRGIVNPAYWYFLITFDNTVEDFIRRTCPKAHSNSFAAAEYFICMLENAVAEENSVMAGVAFSSPTPAYGAVEAVLYLASREVYFGNRERIWAPQQPSVRRLVLSHDVLGSAAGSVVDAALAHRGTNTVPAATVAASVLAPAESLAPPSDIALSSALPEVQFSGHDTGVAAACEDNTITDDSLGAALATIEPSAATSAPCDTDSEYPAHPMKDPDDVAEEEQQWHDSLRSERIDVRWVSSHRSVMEDLAKVALTKLRWVRLGASDSRSLEWEVCYACRINALGDGSAPVHFARWSSPDRSKLTGRGFSVFLLPR